MSTVSDSSEDNSLIISGQCLIAILTVNQSTNQLLYVNGKLSSLAKKNGANIIIFLILNLTNCTYFRSINRRESDFSKTCRNRTKRLRSGIRNEQIQSEQIPNQTRNSRFLRGLRVTFGRKNRKRAPALQEMREKTVRTQGNHHGNRGDGRKVQQRSADHPRGVLPTNAGGRIAHP